MGFDLDAAVAMHACGGATLVSLQAAVRQIRPGAARAESRTVWNPGEPGAHSQMRTFAVELRRSCAPGRAWGLGGVGGVL